MGRGERRRDECRFDYTNALCSQEFPVDGGKSLHTCNIHGIAPAYVWTRIDLCKLNQRQIVTFLRSI